MTFALTSFFADGIRFAGPGPYRATETYGFTITAAASDVTLDLGNTTGTFWTAAQADATYGEMAAQVLTQIERLEANNQAVKNRFVPEIASFDEASRLHVLYGWRRHGLYCFRRISLKSKYISD